jgi:hypothetical protein
VLGSYRVRGSCQKLSILIGGDDSSRGGSSGS